MGNTQVKLTSEEQDNVNKKYMEELTSMVKDFEKNRFNENGLDTHFWLYPTLTAKHPHQTIHRNHDVFIHGVSALLTRPHIRMKDGILFIINAPLSDVNGNGLYDCTIKPKNTTGLTAEEIRMRYAKSKKHAELLQSIEPVRKLESGFFNMSSYYYNEVLDKIYEIENLTPKLCVPNYDEEKILREENNLPMR